MNYHEDIVDSIKKMKRLKYDIENAWTKQEMYESAKLFRLETSKLMGILEEYIKFERENNLPVNLEYRSMYRTLKNQKK